MTKQDFELIAGVIRDLEPVNAFGEPKFTMKEITTKFARALVNTNPQFSLTKFTHACYGVDRK